MSDYIILQKPTARSNTGAGIMCIVHIPVDDIIVPAGRRPVDREKVAQLAGSMKVVGMLQPIIVAYIEGETRLVAGAHRLAAAKKLGMKEVPAVALVVKDVHLRLTEIAENLHRNELTVLERDELLAEWLRLTETKQEVSSQLATKPQGGRPESGVRAAARELGVSKDEAHRAVKVAALSPEAKQAARETGLDDNRSALLAAAKDESPERQVERLKSRANPKPSPPPKSTPAGRLRELLLESQLRVRGLLDRVEKLEAENLHLRARLDELERATPSPAAEIDPLDIPAELRRAAP